MKDKCCIVIPMHSFVLNEFALQSFNNTCNILSSYDISIVCPKSLDINDFNCNIKSSTPVNFVQVDDSWFSTYNSYNLFCLNPLLYESFQQYDYMLIAQTDTWIFKDELQYWCDKGYDYIGAPWCLWCHNSKVCNPNDLTLSQDFIYGKPYKISISSIGNGGLSLRKIKKFIEVTQYLQANSQYYTAIQSFPIIAEDTIFMSMREMQWNLPTCKEALQFSIESNGDRHIIQNNIRPMGCHKMHEYSPKAFLQLFKNNPKSTLMENIIINKEDISKESKATCCVIIPIHSLNMNAQQYASIVQIVKKLSNFDIYVVHPKSLDVSPIRGIVQKDMAFDDMFFKSWGAYNKFCMSRNLYEAFIQYDYMLIAQTDTWIFKDELQYWCDKEYDYIGAPLCHHCKNVKKCNYVEDPTDAIVGNGGLSLRKIKKFIQAADYINDNHLLDSYDIDDTPWEDLFLMRLTDLKWNVPKCCEAVKFSIEGLALKHASSGIMPFGYHNLLKIFPQAAFLLHFNYNIIENAQTANKLLNKH